MIRQLDLGMDAGEQQFRRMMFNIIARNQHDHVKNIAFLMDRNGRWAQAPAFDVTYAYNPKGVWTRQHQMSMNGKLEGFTLEDIRACVRAPLMKHGRDEQTVDEVGMSRPNGSHLPPTPRWTKSTPSRSSAPTFSSRSESLAGHR